MRAPLSLTILLQFESKPQTISHTCIFPSLLFTCGTFTPQRKVLLGLLRFWQKGRQGVLDPTHLGSTEYPGQGTVCWVRSGVYVPTCSLCPTCSLSKQQRLLGEPARNTASKTSCYPPLLLPKQILRINRAFFNRRDISVLISKCALAMWGRRQKNTENRLYRRT